MLAMPAASSEQVLVSITTAPPELPVYEQPICTGEGYIWTPGYWAYGPEGYFWVPGTWGARARAWFAMDSGLLGLE